MLSNEGCNYPLVAILRGVLFINKQIKNIIFSLIILFPLNIHSKALLIVINADSINPIQVRGGDDSDTGTYFGVQYTRIVDAIRKMDTALQIGIMYDGYGTGSDKYLFYSKQGGVKEIALKSGEDINLATSSTYKEFILKSKAQFGQTFSSSSDDRPDFMYIGHAIKIFPTKVDLSSTENMTMAQLADAFGDARKELQVGKLFETIYFLSCKMATLEVASLLNQYGDSLITSQLDIQYNVDRERKNEDDLVLGWDYYNFLSSWNANPQEKLYSHFWNSAVKPYLEQPFYSPYEFALSFIDLSKVDTFSQDLLALFNDKLIKNTFASHKEEITRSSFAIELLNSGADKIESAPNAIKHAATVALRRKNEGDLDGAFQFMHSQRTLSNTLLRSVSNESLLSPSLFTPGADESERFIIFDTGLILENLEKYLSEDTSGNSSEIEKSKLEIKKVREGLASVVKYPLSSISGPISTGIVSRYSGLSLSISVGNFLEKILDLHKEDKAYFHSMNSVSSPVYLIRSPLFYLSSTGIRLSNAIRN